MYSRTDEERAALAAESFRKCGVNEFAFDSAFMPDGGEPGDEISVVARQFTAAELAAWIDKPTTPATLANTCMDIVLAIDDATGGAIPARVNHLADLMDYALPVIINAACRPLGAIGPGEVESMVIRARTTEADLSRFGLGAHCLELRTKYPDPGQLRAVMGADVFSVVVRRPTRSEWDSATKGKQSASMRDLALACIVEPASIEARRELLVRLPGIGSSLGATFAEMRSGGVRTEGKG